MMPPPITTARARAGGSAAAPGSNRRALSVSSRRCSLDASIGPSVVGGGGGVVGARPTRAGASRLLAGSGPARRTMQVRHAEPVSHIAHGGATMLRIASEHSREGSTMYSGGYTGKVLRVDLTSKTFSEEPLPAGRRARLHRRRRLHGQVPVRRGARRLRPARPGEQAHLRARAVHRHEDPLRQPHGDQRQEPADRRHGRRPHRRPLPRGDEARRLRRHHRRGRRREADLAVDQGRQGHASAPPRTLWGMQSSDCQQIIKDKLHDQNVRISCIGPAGEKLSRLACIVNERRVVGRRGLGAVMGAKNLKAIALRGDAAAAIADETVQGGAQAHARRHEGQPGALLAVRPRGHLGQRGELHGARHLPLATTGTTTGRREVRGHHRRRCDRLARRRAAPPAPSARWPAARCGSRRRGPTPAS